MKILVVEDELKLLKSISAQLVQNDFIVDAESNGYSGLIQAKNGLYDLILLDWNLPDMTGIEIIEDLRSSNVSTPVLFLTARDTINDKMLAFNKGADDYIVKPFSYDELILRVKAILRRSPNLKKQITEFGNIQIDSNDKSVIVSNKKIELTKYEFLVLEYLVLQDRLVSKSELIQKLWSDSSDVTENNVEAIVSNLRKKLGKDRKKYIKTIVGLGYRAHKNV